MSKLSSDALNLFRTGRRYYRDCRKSYGHQIKLFNSQIVDFNKNEVSEIKPITYHWLHRFINHRIKLSKGDTLSIFGVNGDKLAIRINRSKYKIFFTIENVHNPSSPWIPYGDQFISDPSINLSLGFDYIVHPQYLRFPYWLMTTFEPTDTLKIIRNKCHYMNKKMSFEVNIRSKFCAFMCRDDYFGHRTFFVNEVDKIDAINFPSDFMHNDDDCLNLYSSNKLDYLHQFKFNLCPENTNTLGYVTEKIFDAVKAGCIPIYWGSFNNPEPDILNHKAVCFLSYQKDNTNTICQISELHGNRKLYKDFILQDRLNKEAPDVIFEYFSKLEKTIKEIVF